jgi:hypothetical protein
MHASNPQRNEEETWFLVEVNAARHVIERLPPAGPVAVERKQQLKSNRSSQLRR